jgi:hypothetical protein
MILFRQGKNMTESYAMRMEPGFAIAEFPHLLLRELLRILGGVVTQPARRLIGPIASILACLPLRLFRG